MVVIYFDLETTGTGVRLAIREGSRGAFDGSAPLQAIADLRALLPSDSDVASMPTNDVQAPVNATTTANPQRPIPRPWSRVNP